MTVLNDRKAATSAPQQIFMDKILQTQMAFHGRAIAVHDIGDRPVTKPLHEFYLDVAAAGRIQQEPPNKCQPEAPEICTYEKNGKAQAS